MVFVAVDKSFVIGENSFAPRDVLLLDKLLEIRNSQELLDQTSVQQKGKINRRYLILSREMVKFFMNEFPLFIRSSLRVHQIRLALPAARTPQAEDITHYAQRRRNQQAFFGIGPLAERPLL